jgi:hypothetical protein
MASVSQKPIDPVKEYGDSLRIPSLTAFGI